MPGSLCLVHVGIEPLLLLVAMADRSAGRMRSALEGLTQPIPGSCLTVFWERHLVPILVKTNICWTVAVYVCDPRVLRQVALGKNRIISYGQMLGQTTCFRWSGIRIRSHYRSLSLLGSNSSTSTKVLFYKQISIHF